MIWSIEINDDKKKETKPIGRSDNKINEEIQKKVWWSGHKDHRGSNPLLFAKNKNKKKKRLEGYLKRYTVAIFTESFIELGLSWRYRNIERQLYPEKTLRILEGHCSNGCYLLSGWLSTEKVLEKKMKVIQLSKVKSLSGIVSHGVGWW